MTLPTPGKRMYMPIARTIEAVHFEVAGTYDVFGTKIEVVADTYAYMDYGGHVITQSGKRFREHWEDVSA